MNQDEILAMMGSKGHLSGRDVQAIMSRGVSRDQLARLATTPQGMFGSTARFGPNALGILGIHSVTGYDPTVYNPSSPFAYSGDTSRRIPMNPNRMGSGYRTETKRVYTRVGPVNLPPQAPPASANPEPSAPSGPRNPNNYPEIDMGVGGGGYGPMTINMPEAPPPQFSPGGVGSSLDSGATGFRRKRSSARLAGLTSKGTSQFRITGQNSKSSGLNIGK